MIFFKSGSFAWDGIVIFWIPFTAFFLWLLIMPFVLCRAVYQETALEESNAGLAGNVADDAIAELRAQVAALNIRPGHVRTPGESLSSERVSGRFHGDA